MKLHRYLAIFLTLVLALTACQPIQKAGAQAGQSTNAAAAATATSPAQVAPTNDVSPTVQTASTGTQAPAATQALSVTQTPAKANSNANPGQMPPQSQAAGVQPKDMRTALTHLSNLIGYQVLDENGNKLGVASDYIVNPCETYIIYILMEPAASLHIPSGNRVVIPFEVVTINSGVLDAQNKSIQLHLTPDQFSGAPTLPAGKQLIPTDWETATRAFWKKIARIDGLTTSCGTSSGATTKIAYATQLSGVKLYDGRNNLLGSVQEAILQPESGQIYFYIIKPAAGAGMVIVPLANTNIPAAALAPGGTLSLVLLADPAAFKGAPRITSIDQADDLAQQGKARQYWNK